MTIQPNREYRDFRARRKADTAAADPARWVWIDNNSFIVTVGGVATNGTYIITINPLLRGTAVPAADPSIPVIPITVTRAGGSPATNTNLATQFVTNTNLLLTDAASPPPTALSAYIESVSSSGAVVQFIVKRGAPPFTVTLSGTGLGGGAGTLVVSPDDVFPITLDTLGYGPEVGARTKLEVTLIPVNSSGVPLDPGTATMDLTVRRMAERGTRNQADRPSTPVGVGSATIATAHVVGAPFRIGGGGGRFAFGLGAIGGGAIATLAAVEVHVREVTE